MPISYSTATPPWLGQPADPSAHYAQGYQQGVHVGAQQAAHLFQQQQLAQQQQRMAMAQQQQEFENQMQSQALKLKAAEAARSHQAAAAYQERVASGEDPSWVLMEMAPMLGENVSSVLHDQRMREELSATMRFRQANMQRLQQAEQARQDRAALTLRAQQERTTVTEEAKKEQQRLAQQREKRLGLAAINRDSELRDLKNDLMLAEDTLTTATKTPIGLFQSQSDYDSNKADLKKARDSAQEAFDRKLNELRKEYGITEEDISPPESSLAPVNQTNVSGTTGVEPTGRIRVRAPDGSTGTISENRLEAALAKGYTRIE